MTKTPTTSDEGMETRSCMNCGSTDTHIVPKLKPAGFSDVTSGAYYAEPVAWAVSHVPQITNGTSSTTFSPEANCTRGQVVTFLWSRSARTIPLWM